MARSRLQSLRGEGTYPQGSDPETRAFIRYWFDDYARRQLAALSYAINAVPAGGTREALWCCFSRLIIAKQAGASRAMDLAHSRPHRMFDRAPRKPFGLFSEALERVIEGCVSSHTPERGPIATIKVGDARRLPVDDESVDLVVSSPPYLNAIDYLRCSKFSLVWMGFSINELRGIRATSIGAEVRARSSFSHDDIIKDLRLKPALNPRMTGILRRYIEDTESVLSEVARVLTQRGRAVYVVGENTIRDAYVPTGRLVARVAEQAGLRVRSRHSRDLQSNRRYLPPPSAGNCLLDGRMRREIILTFEKSNPRRARPRHG